MSTTSIYLQKLPTLFVVSLQTPRSSLPLEESQSASGKYLAENHADDIAKLERYMIYSQRVFYFFLFVVFTNVVLTYFLILHPSRLSCKPNAELCAACAEANPSWTDLLAESIWGKASTAISSTLIICWAVHSYRRRRSMELKLSSGRNNHT
ncbi:hypothetical protein VC83_04058 [Pseudogymnoascus destructans]|uniref:Uncharacterized protein n=2 Tax=Pseudogymnoascus destructans TaxID=655981 RepID=L8G618_PSED2|nr:uncharacterized protein VC83_04058 [Pseudogymnoascus destructans]ELR08562.1 hypothetical protein GMDG_03257 [Pseudogymnoascus destructans 20631-21]OAF59531.1 hypothetical protein VC83_04058 [Pseudogymnoascus destructans]